MSWGGYETKLKLSDMEQCFIYGNIADAEVETNNGAGKSSLTQTILWCLFGQTMYDSKGDDILNWFTDSNCQVTLKFKDGSELTRIRTRKGTTELLLSKASKEIINCTLSTTTNQQKQLEKELGVDFDIFSRSVFFNQYKRPWLDMGDQSRKQILEKIMGIDRLSVYAKVAKKKRDRIELEQEKAKARLESINTTKGSLIKQLDSAKEASDKFEETRADRHAEKIEEAEDYEKQAKQHKAIDIKKLTAKWSIIDKINQHIESIKSKIEAIEDQIGEAEKQVDNADTAYKRAVADLDSAHTKATRAMMDKWMDAKGVLEKASSAKTSILEKHSYGLKSELSEANGTIKSLKSRVELWENKSGKICAECEQTVPATHAKGKIDPIRAEWQTAEDEFARLSKAIEKCTSEIAAEETACKKADKQTEDAYGQKIVEADEALTADKKSARTNRDEDKQKASEDKKRLIKEKEDLEATLEKVKKKVESNKPDMTVKEATAKNSQKKTLLDAAAKSIKEAEGALNEPNMHVKVASDLKCDIISQDEKAKAERRNIDNYNIVYKHLDYIYKAYSDRRKIKSFLISRHRPFFNSRLHYYLEMFGLDVRLSLTDSLALTSNLWGYNMQSGGERSRTDLSFMFAVYDLDEGIHGRQSNILVLDEPDKGLDSAGIQALINIIQNNLAVRFESIFVISHNRCFRDVFPHQAFVERSDRFSYLSDIR